VARRLDDLTHSPHPSQAPASASKAVGEKALNRGDGRHGTFVQSPRTGPEGWGCEQRSRCVYFSAEDGGKKYTTEHRAGLTWACPPLRISVPRHTGKINLKVSDETPFKSIARAQLPQRAGHDSTGRRQPAVRTSVPYLLAFFIICEFCKGGGNPSSAAGSVTAG
jgi:hypothetical protein